jgi:hypothetical protein
MILSSVSGTPALAFLILKMTVQYPKTAYHIYLKDEAAINKVKKANAGVPETELRIIIQRSWKALDDKSKEHYVKLHNK